MMFNESLWLNSFLFAGFTSILVYLWAHYYYDYWKRRGVYSPEAYFPGGHFGKVILGSEQPGVHLGNIYLQTKKHPYVGLYLLHSKTLMVNDLDMIKNFMVKDFHHFTDHGLAFSPSDDPLANHIFNMEGAVWKSIRAKLTPTFTSSKMKYMFDKLLVCSKELENYLEQQVIEGKDVNFREAIAMYGTDVIASCAFGIDTNSFKYPDAEFRRMGRKVFQIDTIKSLKDTLTLYVPSSVFKFFKIRVIYKDIEDFFVKTVSETIKYREENNVTRNDFLQLLIDMKKKDELSGSDKAFSIIEITSQAFLFFIAGFESSSATTSYALYELAKNPRVQEKLREEIDTVLEKHGGKIIYESINEMQYLTQVIEESLRMYPPLPFLFRICTEEYIIPDTNIVIEKGTRVIFPIYGIHRDPDIHSDPKQFKPERFSPENKTKMHPFANLAFGEGPRICIGSRFGIMQTRLGIISTLLKFKLELSDEKTDAEMKFAARSFLLAPEKNYYLRVTRRATK